MSDLRVGYGEASITPAVGVEMTGFGQYLGRCVESVLDDIKARALVLREGGSGLVLINCDLLGLAVDVSDQFRAVLSAAVGLPPANVILACTHTHTGPAAMKLRGMGEPHPLYLARLGKALEAAVAQAEHGLAPAKCSWRITATAPIGYNRRNGTFHPIDPALKLLSFDGPSGRILLLNYACHPVTLGPSSQVSADWPGAVAAELAARGLRAVVFNGFSADINPVTWLDRLPTGTEEDVRFLGRIIADRAVRCLGHLQPLEKTGLRAVEQRVALPLTVPTEEEIERGAAQWAEWHRGKDPAKRLYDEWRADVLARLPALRERPVLANVPVQAAAIGEVKFLGLPGETFCEHGLRLRREWAPLFTLGCCQGNVGYLPTREAYAGAKEKDYECYVATKYYGPLPFAPAVDEALAKAGGEVLRAVTT